MTDSPDKLGLYDRAQVALRPGSHDLSFEQVVTADTGATLAQVDRQTIKLEISAPGGDAMLPATEVLATYPPAGAEDATEVMLPHVVLRTRALPWAYASDLGPDAPWLALLLFVAGEATFRDSGGREVVAADAALLRAIMPRKPEVGLLCHLRALPTDDPIAKQDDDRNVALVLGNRLPRPPAGDTRLEHTACLVDLRGHASSPIWPDSQAVATTVELKLLHKWTFKVSSGGDYEAYFRRLRTDGGRVVVLGNDRDGNAIAGEEGELPLAAAGRTVHYAGPCVPLPFAAVDPPAATADAAVAVTGDGRELIGHAAAFELGRLLALANPRVLDALLGYRDHLFQRDIELVIERPPADLDPSRPIDFRGSWRDLFTDTNDWFGPTVDDLWTRGGDPTGILSLVGKIPGLDADRLSALGSRTFDRRLKDMSLTPGNVGATIDQVPGPPSLGGLDIAVIDVDVLSAMFSELPAAIASAGLDIDQELKR